MRLLLCWWRMLVKLSSHGVAHSNFLAGVLRLVSSGSWSKRSILLLFVIDNTHGVLRTLYCLLGNLVLSRADVLWSLGYCHGLSYAWAESPFRSGFLVGESTTIVGSWSRNELCHGRRSYILSFSFADAKCLHHYFFSSVIIIKFYFSIKYL